ncbi:MAG TPA: monooxygenase [Hyphomonas atlantica]|nr:monooxygenase [Hyphomonas atlantica]
MRVLIAGGGIGGLTAALAFDHFGHECSVIEQSGVLSEIGAGIQLSPNGMHVLSKLGVSAQIARHAFRPKALEMRMGRSGTRLFDIPLRKAAINRWGADYLHVHRADLIQALSDTLATRQPNALRLGAKGTSYEQDDAGVHAVLDSGERVSGDLLVGADGIHSAIRAKMLGPDAPRYTGMTAWRAVTPVSDLTHVPPPTAAVWTGSRRHAVTYLLRGGSLANFVGVVERKAKHLESWTTEGSREDALADFSGWNPVVNDIIQNAPVLHRWALFDRDELKRWSDGRAVLLGDACHPMLPFLAQGAVMAIEDAYVLARSVTSLADLPSAFKAYETLRKPRTSKVQAGARANAKLFHKSNPVTKLSTYGPMWVAGRMMESFVHGRNDWLYGHDVTVG